MYIKKEALYHLDIFHIAVHSVACKHFGVLNAVFEKQPNLHFEQFYLIFSSLAPIPCCTL